MIFEWEVPLVVWFEHVALDQLSALFNDTLFVFLTAPDVSHPIETSREDDGFVC